MIDFDDLQNSSDEAPTPAPAPAQQQSVQQPNKPVDLLEATIAEQLGEDEQSEEASDTTTEAEGSTEEASSASKDAGKDGNSGTVDGKPQPGKEDKTKSVAGPQDLTLADGTVVKAGPERRFYEQLQLTRRQNADLNNTANQLRQTNEQLRTQMKTFEQAAGFVQGLPVTEVGDAVNLARALKRDPTGTIKLLLTEAAKAGISLDGVVTGIDVDAAVAKMRQEFAPLIEQRQQEQEASRYEQEAAQEANQFFQQFPDAAKHDGLIAQMLRADPSLSLSDAYYQLQNAFIERGLDWNRPLAEQAGNVRNPKPGVQTQNGAPMTNGRNIAPGVQIGEANRTVVASADTSYNTIIREAMKEAGMSTK